MNELQHREEYTWAELYPLLGQQVKSYHKHYHMGENSSVPVEVAQELLASICYTLELAGQSGSTDARLRQGQDILAVRLEKAQRLYRLVTAAQWGQGAWFWEDMAQMGHYLDRYDHLHFAHRSPAILCYPTAMPMPDGVQGIDQALFYLRCLWLEEQIMDAFAPDTLAELEAQMPPGSWDGPEMVCEQPLCNALGRTLLGLPLDGLLLPVQYEMMISEEAIRQAEKRVCSALRLSEEAACYAKAVMDGAAVRLLAGADPGGIFLYQRP